MDLVALFGISSYFLLSAFFLARTSLLYCAVNRRLTRSPVNTPHRWRLVTPNALASSQIPCNLRLTGGVSPANVTRNMDVVWQIFRKSSTECFKKREKHALENVLKKEKSMLWKIAAKTLLLPLNIDSEPPPILPQILSMLRAHVLRVLRGLKLAALIQPSFAGLVG